VEKIIDIEDRIPTLRERRKKRTNRKFTLLLFLFLLTLLGLLYFKSPYSLVQKIHVDGASLASSESYIKKSGIKTGQSMWEIRTSSAEKSIQSNEWVKSVKVKRSGLTSVQIQIEEWQKAAYMETENDVQMVLGNGKLFKTNEEFPPIDAPLLSDFEDEAVRLRLVKELTEVDSNIFAMISQIESTPSESDPYRIRLFMNDGNEVRAIIPSFAKKINYYPALLEQIDGTEKGVIDLEVGSFFQSYTDMYNPQPVEEAEDEETTAE
jgi:cell division protein FtsQ